MCTARHEIQPVSHNPTEAVWGSDPLEHLGGFRKLEYDVNATFRSSLAANASISWSNVTAKLTDPDRSHAWARVEVDFPEIEWESMRNVYGWAAYQWQAWVRSEIIVQSDTVEVLTLYTPRVLEFWIDGVNYFGGDFYAYNRTAVTLRLASGKHRVDVRLIRDVRSMGGVERPAMAIDFALEKSLAGQLRPALTSKTGFLISDIIDFEEGLILASPWASIVLRNDGEQDVYIVAVDATHNACIAELVSKEDIRIVPGQSRPVAFKIGCARLDWRIRLDVKYRGAGKHQLEILTVKADPVHRAPGQAHKVTFLHPAGAVSYAMVRPPSSKAVDLHRKDNALPIMLGLHGAGVEAEWDDVRNSLEPLPDLPAWVVFPTGGTPWSGDDWHTWGLADVEAAIAMIPDWIEQTQWKGPGVDPNRWLVAGHSNGGQGTWYFLTHRPDKIIAAAELSGYASIQSYVPYTFWQPDDPGRTAVVQAALASYRHEVLLPNTKGIPVLQQHGSADDNVPVYHNRMQSQLIHGAGWRSNYYELPGFPHFWEGVYTMDHLKEFYQNHLQQANSTGEQSGLYLDDFSLVVANPGDMGSKQGLEVRQLVTPGQIGRINVVFDPLTSACMLRTSNIRSFSLPAYFRECSLIMMDNQSLALPMLEQNQSHWLLTRSNRTWHFSTAASFIPPPLSRLGRQLGPMDSILRTHEAFQIVHTNSSSATQHIALQISRNLCQYFAADTVITSDYDSAFAAPGNVITVATAESPPTGYHKTFPIQVEKDKITIDHAFGEGASEFLAGNGLAAIFLRPLPLGRLELVVWGTDEESLAIAARLVPMMPGSGQPDFVVADRTMLAKGLEGVLAMGFFDSEWEVSRNSFLS